MKTVTIEVTQEDIDNGYPRRCVSCPIALAAQRTLKWDYIWVDGLSVSRGAVGIKLQLPKEAVQFTEDFDTDKHCQPFAFNLEIPE